MYDFGDFEITKRELLVSVSIVLFMFVVGLYFHNNIEDAVSDSNDKYNKAIKIEDKDLFEYGMRTNAGNAFVYGKLEAVDTVTYPEIGGKYMYVEKVKERYTMHSRTVCTKVGKSHTCRVEYYWTWDRVGSAEISSKEVTFLDVKFSTSKFDLPRSDYIDTIKESGRVRYKYYGVNTKYIGTIFTKLKDHTISDKSSFYNDHSIQEAYDSLISSDGVILFIFWLFWILLTGGLVYGFYYLENEWLE